MKYKFENNQHNIYPQVGEDLQTCLLWISMNYNIDGFIFNDCKDNYPVFLIGVGIKWDVRQWIKCSDALYNALKIME